MRLQADLPGPVDHAHAAAGDLLQQLVVAEVRDLAEAVGGRGGFGRGDGRRRTGRSRAERLGHLLDTIVIGEERLQLAGQVGITGQPFLLVEKLAGVHRCQIGRDRFIDLLFPPHRLAGVVRHGAFSFRAWWSVTAAAARELGQPALEQPCHGGGSAIQAGTDLGQREPLTMAQHQGLALDFRLGRQGIGQVDGLLLALGLLAGRGLLGRQPGAEAGGGLVQGRLQGAFPSHVARARRAARRASAMAPAGICRSQAAISAALWPRNCSRLQCAPAASAGPRPRRRACLAVACPGEAGPAGAGTRGSVPGPSRGHRRQEPCQSSLAIAVNGATPAARGRHFFRARTCSKSVPEAVGQAALPVPREVKQQASSPGTGKAACHLQMVGPLCGNAFENPLR